MNSLLFHTSGVEYSSESRYLTEEYGSLRAFRTLQMGTVVSKASP